MMNYQNIKWSRQTDYRNLLNESEIEYILQLLSPKHSAYPVLKEMLWCRRKEDKQYLDNFITAADYVDDMYEEEYATVIVEEDRSAGPWVYRYEQRIPNIDPKEKTHKEFGFVGRLPGSKRKRS